MVLSLIWNCSVKLKIYPQIRYLSYVIPTTLLANHTKEDLTVVLKELTLKKSYLMLDEAFMDFVDVNQTMTGLIQKYNNLIILKSVTKFFALPGLRLGFVLAHPELINKFHGFKDPWNINTFAGL